MLIHDIADVFVEVGSTEIVFVECKGHLPTGEGYDAEVEKWLMKRIPVLRDFAKHEEGYAKLKQTCSFGQTTPSARNRRPLSSKKTRRRSGTPSPIEKAPISRR